MYCHHCPLVVISRCSNMARLLLVCAESLILIHPLIALTQLQQLPKQTQTWLVQPISIHLLPVMLHPRVQSSFLQIIFGKIPSVHFYEGLYLMEVRHPSLVLCHTFTPYCVPYATILSRLSHRSLRISGVSSSICRDVITTFVPCAATSSLPPRHKFTNFIPILSTFLQNIPYLCPNKYY